jgi:hypothetical protein
MYTLKTLKIIIILISNNVIYFVSTIQSIKFSFLKVLIKSHQVKQIHEIA